MKAVKKILNFIIGVADFVLLIIIIINIVNIIATRALKAGYINFLDYTYFIIESDDTTTNTTSGSLVIIDLKKTVSVDDIVAYKSGEDFITGKVISLSEEETIIETDQVQSVIEDDLIVGEIVQNIPTLGNIMLYLEQIWVFVGSIVLLIILSYVSSLLKE